MPNYSRETMDYILFQGLLVEWMRGMLTYAIIPSHDAFRGWE